MMHMGPGRQRGGHRGPGGVLLQVEKPRDFKGAFAKLVRYLSIYRWRLVIVLAFAIASTIAAIYGPKYSARATTALFEGVLRHLNGTGGIDFDYIGRILLNTLGLYLLSGLFSYVQGWIMTGVAMEITYRLRREIAEKIHRMPLRYFDGTNHGEILSRVTNDVDTISQTLNQGLTQIVTSLVTVLGIVVMMFSISWVMTLVALIVIPLSLAVTMVVIRSSQRYFSQQQDYLGHVNGHVEEMYGGHTVMKAFNGEARSMAKLDAYNEVLYAAAWKSQFLSGLMFPVMNFIGNLSYVAVCLLGGWLTTRGTLTVGDIGAFIQYVRSFNHPITQLANISNVLQQTAAAAERVFEFLAEAEEVPDAADAVQLTAVAGRVEFRNVRFGYHPDKIIIHNFCAQVEPGRRIAIVGPTGAGKTTIVKLLMRFYDVNDGAIFIDGCDLRRFSRRGLRRLFGMVLQDAWLYNGTIMDNIRYGRPEASAAEVVTAARLAHVDHFVRTLPEGYDLVLNEETTNISQGQKQLLTIARAILADPKILILDEATSSVDTRTEVLIQRAMHNLMRERTSFIIAHRLSTIRDADWILVMNDGDIVEQGTHTELLVRNGFYAELYNSQFDSLAAEVVEPGTT